ncbi:MAG: hypothetical protein JOZ41_18135 [Chloroflexi bacterium]|nr:hypothetical protein [Chloroflexota bacterium]
MKRLILAAGLTLALAGVGTGLGSHGTAAAASQTSYKVGDINWATIVPPAADTDTDGYMVVNGSTVTFYRGEL